MKNNNSIKIYPWFPFEVFFYWEDDNNWLMKLWLFESFWGPPLIQFSKLNYFLWLCWFFGKNLSNFVPPFENFTTCIAMINTFKTDTASTKVILKPRWAGYKNRCRCKSTFVFMVLCSKFAFWVNLHHTLWVSGRSNFLSGS